jgi:hypothetical protein
MVNNDDDDRKLTGTYLVRVAWLSTPLLQQSASGGLRDLVFVTSVLHTHKACASNLEARKRWD